MKFYFSGISSAEELEMLEEAKVSHLLVDPTDYLKLGDQFPDGPDDYWEPSWALDSGAYRAWKEQKEYLPEKYEEFLRRHIYTRSHRPDFITSLDILDTDPIGNIITTAGATMDYWDWLVERGHQVMPVWHWGEPQLYLDLYLDSNEVVGIGGLVPYMRDKNEKVLLQLTELCWQHEGRFHLFGLCWPKAIETVRDYAYSADSSVWLRGARYAYAVFQHTGHGHLTQAPARLIPEYEGLDRFERCVLNAKNIEKFCWEG